MDSAVGAGLGWRVLTAMLPLSKTASRRCDRTGRQGVVPGRRSVNEQPNVCSCAPIVRRMECSRADRDVRASSAFRRSLATARCGRDDHCDRCFRPSGCAPSMLALISPCSDAPEPHWPSRTRHPTSPTGSSTRRACLGASHSERSALHGWRRPPGSVCSCGNSSVCPLLLARQRSSGLSARVAVEH